MTTVEQESEDRLKKPLQIVGGVCVVIPVINQATTITCDSPSLKWILLAILFISSSSFCILIFKNAYELSRLGKWCWVIGCGLCFIFFAISIYNKKCAVPETGNNIYNNQKTYNNYNKLPQRTLTSEDVADLKAKLPDPKTKVIVQYLQSSAEDTLLLQQVVSALGRIGHSNVIVSQAVTLPNDLTPGRMTIRKELVENEFLYKVIINPQQ